MPNTLRVLGKMGNRYGIGACSLPSTPCITYLHLYSVPMNIHFAHAHIATSTADCDGPMHREYTVFVSDEAKAKSAACDGINDFWEIDFRNDVLTSQVSLTTVEFGLRMTATEDGFEWVQPTDEGYRSGEVRWCDEESCSPTYSQRDVFAEMMGY